MNGVPFLVLRLADAVLGRWVPMNLAYLGAHHSSGEKKRKEKHHDDRN